MHSLQLTKSILRREVKMLQLQSSSKLLLRLLVARPGEFMNYNITFLFPVFVNYAQQIITGDLCSAHPLYAATISLLSPKA